VADQVAQNALDRALDEKDLLLVYQPIHDARTRRIHSAEALLRQRRQDGEIREASVIMETAEKGPEVFELELWTIKHALQDATRWHSGTCDVKVNVNISPRIFEEGSGRVLDRMTEMTSDCGIDSANVNIEMTETSYIEDPKDTMYALRTMKERGFNLWLDDFGTGHSSIEHLQLFPLDGIKIPGTFVKGIAKDERCRTIVRTLVRLAHDLGLKVVAEGIEHQSQLDFLLEHECDYIQGFLVSKPMTVGAFEALLRCEP
jgi:EAL domain-containing protein (putative c-di-GMP-specific phosphodiesterase class I)